MTQAEVCFCPRCNAATLDIPEIIGPPVKCRACGWSGPKEELIHHVFEHGMGSHEDIMRQFAFDVRALFTQQMGTEIGRLLLHWGFFETGNPTVEELKRYLTAIARSTAKAILEEREKIALEKAQCPVDPKSVS